MPEPDYDLLARTVRLETKADHVSATLDALRQDYFETKASASKDREQLVHRITRMEDKIDQQTKMIEDIVAQMKEDRKDHASTRTQLSRWRGGVAAFASIGVIATLLNIFGFKFGG